MAPIKYEARKRIVTATPKKPIPRSRTPAPNISTVRLRTRTAASNTSTIGLGTRTPAPITPSSSARKEQKSPSRGPRFALSDEEPTQSPTRSDYARISDFPDLSFRVASIKGMHTKSGDNCVVYDDKGRQHIVQCKAVAKQNPDLMLEYFLSLSRSR
uniref:Uncharacterized protein n=1 Tax=Panagrolaimus sp. PS1159 TaxID=55785 RepID=A0AC35FII0_9BILA